MTPDSDPTSADVPEEQDRQPVVEADNASPVTYPRSITTRTGDSGFTSIQHGVRLRKDHYIIEANGMIDELSSYLGLVAALLESSPDSHADFTVRAEELIWCQRQLFHISSMIASVMNQEQKARLGDTEVQQLEAWLNHLSGMVPPLRHFILPGGNVMAGHLHVVRAICRRTERACVPLMVEESIQLNPVTISFLNRLSDYLFVLARWTTFVMGHDERLSKPPEKN